jgi:NitT/TauT family transport system substrate-binding protein
LTPIFGVRTILTSNEVMDGPRTLTMLYTRSTFHADNTQACGAVLRALQEAIAFINSDKRGAALNFLAMGGQGLRPAEVLVL